MVIAVDFDGTIVKHVYPMIGEQIGRSVEILKLFKEKFGCQIILWTCREVGCGLEEAVAWCLERGLEFDAINANASPVEVLAAHKILADIYIDDRCFERFLCGRMGDMTAEEWEFIADRTKRLCLASETQEAADVVR